MPPPTPTILDEIVAHPTFPRVPRSFLTRAPKLKTGELIGTYPGGVAEELRSIKTGMRTESDIFSRIFQLEQLCREAYDAVPLPDQPDTASIEEFLVRCYK